MSSILSLQEAAVVAEKARAEGKTIVTTNGTFDLLHAGHLFLLSEARKQGDVLMVGVNSDASVRRYKGPGRPIEPEQVRAEHIAAHADAVFIFDDDDPRGWLKKIHPHVHANAETYGPECIEAPVLRQIGARLHLVPVKKELGSTTEKLQTKGKHMNTVQWALLTLLCSPFLALTALFHQFPRKKILVIQWGKLGDLACTTGLFRAIKEQHPDWEVHVFCRAECAVALQGNPFVDRVHAVKGSRIPMIRQLKSEGYYAVINCLPDAMGSTIGLWCMAPVRINAWTDRLGRLVRWFKGLNTVNVEYRQGMNTFDHYMKLAEPLGVRPIPYTIDFFPSAEDQRKAEQWMQERKLAEKKFIGINISAGNVIKEWPMQKILEFCDRAVEELDLDVFLSTLDAKRVEQVRYHVRYPDRIHDASMLTLGQLGAVSRKAAAYVAVDTGPLYIVYGAGGTVVALIGGSDVREQLPRPGPRAVLVPPPPGCTPWMHVAVTARKATPEQLRCIHDTSVENVLNAVRSVLN